MGYRFACSVTLSLLIASVALADIPSPDGRPRQRALPYPPDDFVPKQPPRLVITMDPTALTARLVLPANPTAAAPSESPRLAQLVGFPWLGLALTGSLIAGGLWFARVPKAKWIVAAALPLCAIALAGFAIAQPAQPAVQTLESMKVRIGRGNAGSEYQLILPRRPVAEKK